MTVPFYYNFRNLLVRKLSTLLTFVVVAVVVFVLAVLLSFAAGISASLGAAGSEKTIMVLARGATAESTSIILPEEAMRLAQTPGAARDSAGGAVLSREICVQTSLPRLGPERNMANVAVRGVEEAAFVVHGNVRITQGRKPREGAPEAIVGNAARERYANLSVGDKLPLGRLGNREFEIVGVFDAGGSSLESEIWAPRTMIADVFKRDQLSSVLIPLVEGAAAQISIDYIRGPSVGLDAKTESEYYRELSAKTKEIVVLATFLVGIMGIGAVFAVANTMYAAVDSRRREIAMLRTLGFRRRSIVLTFTVESLMTCVPAALAGLGASHFLTGKRQDYLSDATWTVLAFELKLTPQICFVALLLATTVGIAGAIAPALRAARTQILVALRKA